MVRQYKDWQQYANNIALESRAFIAGRFQEAADGKTFAVVNPANKEKLVDVVWCGEVEIEQAVRAARQAFDSGIWSDKAPEERAEILKRFAQLIRQHNDELALLETLNVGKPIGISSTVDIPAVAHCVEWFAETIGKVHGEIPDTQKSVLGLVTREPLGVVAAVVPWNFPLLMAAWKFGPALAAGNAIIVKPSEKSPLTAIRVAALAKEAGVPDGIFQVLPGPGDVGKALALHQQVDSVTFTGSTHVGKLIAGYAAQSNLKRVSLELGGKSPNVVLADCPSIEEAARAAASGIFFNSGQVCTAGSRLLIHKSIKAPFLEALREAAQAYYPGDPLNPETKMGTIVDAIQYNKVLSYIEKGNMERAGLLFGGKAVDPEKGLFIEPTVFDCPNPNMGICREEIFGPVLSVITFEGVEEAVALANDSEYGLGAAVWTSSLATAHQVSRRLRAGTVWVNCYDEYGSMSFPFGGVKQSGYGRDKSLHALEKYTELKSTLIKLI